MNPDARQAAEQLVWWLKLPPVNLMDRGDRLRFRYALYLITTQVAAVLYGLNGRPSVLSYPSGLQNACSILNALPVAPLRSGDRLAGMIAAGDDRAAWQIARSLIEQTLTLIGRDLPGQGFDPGRAVLSHEPDALYRRAEHIALLLSEMSSVEAAGLAGSLARGLADQQSDIDLSIFCRALPLTADRLSLLRRLPNARTPILEHACDTVWSDGALIHLRYWRLQEVDEMVAALPRAPADPFMAEELQLARPVYDPRSRLARWKERVSRFSPELIRSILDPLRRRRQEFHHAWDAAIRRGDLIHLYCLANQMANDWLIALYALNHRFMTTPRWTHREMAGMTDAPVDALIRLESVAGAMSSPDAATPRKAALDLLWQELRSV